VTTETIIKFVKLFARLYLKFFFIVAFALIVGSIGRYLIDRAIIFDSFETIARIMILIPLLVTLLQIGFDVWEGKTNDT